MGGRSKNKSSSGGSSAEGNMDSAMKKLPPVSGKDSAGLFNGMFSQQMGALGDVLGGLIENGQQMMSDNPALANFTRAVGGMPMQFETPGFVKDLQAKYGPADEPAAPAASSAPQQEPQWMANMTPEMKQRYYANQGQSPYGFNINNYMRDQNLGGGQGGR